MKKFLAKAFTSRKFVTGISAMLFTILNECLGWGVSEETITQVVTLAATTIGGLAVVDVAAELKKK